MRLFICFVLLHLTIATVNALSGDESSKGRLPTQLVTDDVYAEALEKKKNNEMQVLRLKYTAREKRLYRIMKNRQIVYRLGFDPVLGRETEHLVYMADDGEFIIPRSCDVSKIISFFYKKFKGENALKLWARIRQHYANISRPKIQQWLNSCREHCEEFPVFLNKPKLRPIPAKRPMDQLQADLVDLSKMPSTSGGTTYRYVFACLDVFSRFVVLAPMTGKTPEEAALIFRQTVLQIGMPKRLQTDQGSEFKGIFQEMVDVLGPRWIKSSPYHPQSQGRIEKSHGTWKKKLRFDLERGSDSWSDHLCEYAFQYNTGAHQSLGGLCPFEVFFGRKPNVDQILFESIPANAETAVTSFTNWQKEQNAVRVKAKLHSTKSSLKMVERHQRRHPTSKYELGAEVIVKPAKAQKKIQKGSSRMLSFPGVVAGVKGSNYKVRYDDGKGFVRESWFAVSALTSRTLNVERARQRAAREKRSASFHMNSRSEELSSRAGLEPGLEESALSDQPKDEPDAIPFRRKEQPFEITSLVRVLSERNLELVDMEGDGNCFYHAVAHQVLGSADRHCEVRLRAVDYIINHADEFREVVDANDVNKFIDENIDPGSWADHIMIQAVSNAYDIHIEIINSNPQRFAPTVVAPSHSSNAERSGRMITLGAIEQLHYVSTQPVQPFALSAWGGVTSHGLTLANTCSLDGPLSFIMLLLHTYPAMLDLEGEHMDIVRCTLKLFQKGNVTDAKFNWYNHFGNGDFEHQTCDMHGSEAQLFFEPVARSPLGNIWISSHSSCTSCKAAETSVVRNLRPDFTSSQRLDKAVEAIFKPSRKLCISCGGIAFVETLVRGTAPPLLIIPADQISRVSDLESTLQLPVAGSTPTYVLMYIGVKKPHSDHFVAFFRWWRSPWCLFDGLNKPLLQTYNQPTSMPSVGTVTFLIYVALKYVGSSFKSLKNEIRRLTRYGTQVLNVGNQKIVADSNTKHEPAAEHVEVNKILQLAHDMAHNGDLSSFTLSMQSKASNEVLRRECSEERNSSRRGSQIPSDILDEISAFLMQTIPELRDTSKPLSWRTSLITLLKGYIVEKYLSIYGQQC